MHIAFDSIDELEKFIKWVNKDKDQIIKEASNELNKETVKLKESINQEKK
jgi:uncharacterized protein YdcH (DUF465 family)